MKLYNNGTTVTNKVSTLWPYEANTCEENRIKFVTDLAAISRGKHESKNPAVRYKQLLKEAAPIKIISSCPVCECKEIKPMVMNGIEVNHQLECTQCGYTDNPNSMAWFKHQEGTPSRPLEFLGIALEYFISSDTDGTGSKIVLSNMLDGNQLVFEIEEFNNLLGRYSYMLNGYIYTNMRACLNAGIPYDIIPYNTKEELIDFKAVRIKAPMFVFNHLITHTAFSKEARSERVVELSTNGYWLPEDFREKLYEYYTTHKATPINITDTPDDEIRMLCSILLAVEKMLSFQNFEDLIEYLVDGDLSQAMVQRIFRAVGYPIEISQRAMLEMRFKEFLLVAWDNDPTTWYHLFLERNAFKGLWKNWTQNETTKTVEMIKEVLS